MKTNLNFGLNSKNNPSNLPNQEILLNWTLYGLNKKYGENLKGQVLRTVNRLLKKFQDASDQKLESIELEESEKDILKEVFGDEIGYPVGASEVVVAVQNEIKSWTAQ